jgi:hypothetical protein
MAVLRSPEVSNCLLVFVKNALKGRVKSRLAKSIGEPAALGIYNELIGRVKKILLDISYDKFIFYSDFVDRLDVFENEKFEKRLQKGDDLGERMNNAFYFAFELKYEKVVLIGSDIPKLSEKILLDAFHALNKFDLVLGPAKDGGYYLIGMKKHTPELFSNMVWSTEEVRVQTIRKAEGAHLSIKEMPYLSDLDTFEDLAELDEKERFLFNKIIRKARLDQNEN